MAFQRLLHLDGHTSPVLCCTSSSHVPGAQHMVASGSEDGSMCLHDVHETRLAHKLTLGGEDDAVSSLVFHPTDPNQLFAASASEVKRIDLRTPSIASTFSCNKDEVNQVAINAKGNFLAAADDAGDVQVLDLAAGKLFKGIQAAHSNIASSVCFRAHKPWELITAGFDQTVARWDFSRGKCLARMRIEMEATAEGESQLFNPPMVHALAVPGTSSRPWCQVAAAARGDGTVEVFDVDEASSSNSSSTAVSRGAKPASKGRGVAASHGAAGVATAGGNAIGSSSSSSSSRLAGDRGSGGRPWRWPLVLNRARGGHTRPATTVCFVGDAEACNNRGGSVPGSTQAQEPASSSGTSQPKGNSGSGSSGKHAKGGLGSGAPTHLLSGSEDRRLLLWRLPRLRQGQAGLEPDLGIRNEQGMEGGGALQGSGDGEEERHLVAEHHHGRKVNCLHVSALPQQGLHGAHLQHLSFVGDTSKRLQVYKLSV
ncbi:WD40-repeat-containing domain protein [Dunaliella salina]|uniref:WD40-repeat-containing domain protein n=1 Tax=Dunaliella salina TaxID=3046 RepID=A0ABQ7H1M6_DUNSA|nr:WD40-repeat-containing domain protein [Dunaliella salina]|eukprot:KAF5840759.1 WD40-repeat-containing domain protein [Dunaliella salina]